MGRVEFKNWLIHYKEFGARKAENWCSLIDKLSDTALESGVSEYPVYSISSYTNLGKWRRNIGDAFIIANNESKAISLFGDYLDYIARTNIVNSDVNEIKLVEYCKSMSMSYSYKAVLIMEMIDHMGADCSIDIDLLVEKMIEYYSDRRKNNEIIEQSTSLFARVPIDPDEAKKNVVNNPINVLERAGVIKREGNSIRLASEYFIDPNDYIVVKESCAKRLSEYYIRVGESLKSVDDSIDPFERLEIAINQINDDDDRNNCVLALSAYKNSVGFKESSNPLKMNKFKISEDDSRKVGRLVQETMSELSASGYSFTDAEFSMFTSKEWSKEVLGLYYPLMKPYMDDKPIKEQIIDYRGNGRYYKHVYLFGDRKVLLTSEWYIENKPKYIQWYNRLGVNN